MYKRKRHIDRLMICLLDLLLVIVSLLLSGMLRYKTFDVYDKAEHFKEVVWIFAVIHIALFYVSNIFKSIYRRNKYQELLLCFVYSVTLVGIAMVVTFSLKISLFTSRLVFGYFLGIFTLLTAFMHSLYRNRSRLSLLGKKNLRNIIIISDKESMHTIINKLSASKEFNWDIVALVPTTDDDDIDITKYNIPILSLETDSFYEFCTQHALDEVFIHSNYLLMTQGLMSKIVLFFEQMGVVVDVCLDEMEPQINGARQVYTVEGYPVIAYSSRLYDYRMLILKRIMDVVGGVVGLALTAVASVFVIPAILIESPGPIFFTQNRVGMNGRIFKIYKFRSMYKDAEERKKELEAQNEMNGLMFKMENDPRITKVGRFIRKTSIDELPQFWNVIKGDMSLVGTRPPTVDEYMQYNAYQKRRISFRPGITGLWQVSGRSSIKDFDEIVKLDLKYIDQWSILLDIRIIFKTVLVVLLRKGAE